MTIQVNKDLTSRIGSVRDQGRRPTCVAFAASDLHAAVRNSTFSPLSVEYLFYHACKLVAPFNPHAGVTLNQILKAVEAHGQPEEVHWPYFVQLPSDLSTYFPPSMSAPIYRRAGQIITNAPVDGIADELTNDRPSVLVFRSTLQFVLAGRTSPVAWSSTDQFLTPHAVLAVGLGDNQAKRVVRVRNSWGGGWADGGFAWLTEEYIQKTFIALVRMV